MSLQNKLIRIEYELGIFSKNSNESVEVLDLTATVEDIKLILIDEQNFSTCDGILLNLDQLNKLKIFIDKYINFDLTKYDYYLLESGVYNW